MIIWIILIILLILVFNIIIGNLGQQGEDFVIKKLNTLNPEKYKIINNVLLRSLGNTSTTQIDHIVVSNFGIFCIETKAYKGWIFGNYSQEYWTQVIFKKKYRFYNPFKQNYAHTKALEVLLGNHLKSQIISFVIFPRASKIKVSGTNLVGYTYEILDKITAFNKEIYTNEEKDYIFDVLGRANISIKKERTEHDKQVKEIQLVNEQVTTI